MKKVSHDELQAFCNGELFQSVFMHSSLESYFEAVAELCGQSSYLKAYEELKPYTRVSPFELIYDPDIPHTDCLEDITVGEMLNVAANLLMHNRSSLNDDRNTPDSELTRIGRRIVQLILVLPLTERPMEKAVPNQKKSKPRSIKNKKEKKQ